MKRMAKVTLGLIVTLFLLGMLTGCRKSETSGHGTGTREEYKILNYEGAREDRELEALLNETAKEGWKVRALDWNKRRIILAR